MAKHGGKRDLVIQYKVFLRHLGRIHRSNVTSGADTILRLKAKGHQKVIQARNAPAWQIFSLKAPFPSVSVEGRVNPSDEGSHGRERSYSEDVPVMLFEVVARKSKVTSTQCGGLASSSTNRTSASF